MEDLQWMGLQWDAGPGRAQARRGVPPVAPRRGLRASFGHARCARAHVPVLLHAARARPVAQGAARRRAAAALCRHLPRTLARGARAQERAGHLADHAVSACPPAGASSSTTWCTERRASPPTTSAISSCGAPMAARRSSSAMPSTMPEMGITHVLRGEDHLTNTPRQLLVLEALELRAPTYGHLSLLVGADGSPLSKRHGATSVREFRERGYLPRGAGESPVPARAFEQRERRADARRHGARIHGQTSRARAGALRGIAAQRLAARSRASHAARGERALARGRDAARHRRRAPPRVHRRHPSQRAAAVGRRALARCGVRRRAGAR